MAKIKVLTLVFLVVGVFLLSLQHTAYAVSCNAIVGDWAWFNGGRVTLNPNGTITSKEFGKIGTWECTDAARAVFTLRWVFGTPPFVDTLTLSVDGKSLSGKNQYQYPVTANRISIAKKVAPKNLQEKKPSKPTQGRKDTYVYRGTWMSEKDRQGRVIRRMYVPNTSGDYASQIAEYTKAIEVQEEQGETLEKNIIVAGWYLDLAEVKRAMGKGEEADREVIDIARKNSIAVDEKRIIDVTTRMINREPNNPELYELRAMAYFKKEDYEKLLADRTKLIGLGKDNEERARAYSSRSWAYRLLKNYTAALADINKAIELNPSSSDYFNRAQIFKETNVPLRVIEDYTTAIRLVDKKTRTSYLPDYLHGRAEAYYQVGKFELARADLDEALKINPSNVRALSLRAQVLLELKQDDAAKADMKALRKASPKYYQETFQPKMKEILERRQTGK